MDILPRSRREKLIDMGLARFDGRLIIYESVGHQDEIGDPEEQVRADLYLDLVEKYGYNTPNAVEMEKYYKIGHPHKRSDAKVDVIVKYPDGRPFLVIELKSPGDYDRYMEDSLKTQVFNIAAVENQVHGSIRYLVYHTRYWENGTLHHKTVCIDYEKYRSFEEWDKDGRENLREIPTNYGQVTVPRFIKGGEIDLRLDVTNDELQRIRMNLHNILWGGGKYQNELFFNLVGLFLVKIYDEKETEDGHPYQFQTFYTNGKPEGAKMIYDRLNGLYFKALEEYLGYSEDELRKVKDIIFDPAKVRYVVEVLQEICFTVNRFDVIGSFFESVVRGEFKQSKGQYLTHLNIVNFMVEGLQLGEMSLGLINNEKRLPYIIDPACGSGSFLIESMKHITAYILHNKRYIKKSASVKEFYETSFPTLRKNAWAKEYVYGIEVNGGLAAATKVNMVGHGDGSASIEAKDALLPFENFGLGLLQIAKSSTIYPKPVNEQFDVILTNPPSVLPWIAIQHPHFLPIMFKGKLSSGGFLEMKNQRKFLQNFYL